MLDLERLKKIKMGHPPWGQIVLANTALFLSYRLPRKTRIDLEGLENLPTDRRVFLVMNHTDKYNYWPLQYALYRQGFGFTATWVKGKNYEAPALGWFMDTMSNIPLPSRGYVLTTEFRKQTGRVPDEGEYRALRALLNDGALPEDAPAGARAFLEAKGGPERFVASFTELFGQMIDEVTRITGRALRGGYHILVFPQGTRSVRLSRGHTGMAMMSQALGADIVPVGCNGSDHVYPGDSPWAGSKGGHITYRIGKPLLIDGPELGPHRVTERFTPLTDAAAEAHGPAFRAITDIVMDKINALVDPRYQFAEDQESDGVQGINRFV